MKLVIFLSILMSVANLSAQTPGRGIVAQTAVDPALQPPIIFTKPSSKYGQAARQWQGIAGIERAPNGRLWAVWYSGGKGEGPGNFVMLVTSKNDGRTWSSQKLVIAPAPELDRYVREFDPCLWLDPTGRLWLFWAQSITHWDGRGGVWAISTNSPGSASPKWTKPRRLTDGVMLNKPLVSSSGSWLLPIAGWRNYPLGVKQSTVDISGLPLKSLVHTGGQLKGSNVFESKDRLGSIHFLGQAQVPDTWFDESMLVERRDHLLWMLVRTKYGIGQAISKDQGRSWTSLGNTGLSHVNSRFFIRRLRSGNLLLVSNLPLSGTSRTRLTARVSTDDGKIWSTGLVLDDREQVAYPDGVQAPDGQISIIYDHDRQGVGEIMLAKFTERDVLAGRIVSGQSHLRQVVNAIQRAAK